MPKVNRVDPPVSVLMEGGTTRRLSCRVQVDTRKSAYLIMTHPFTGIASSPLSTLTISESGWSSTVLFSRIVVARCMAG